MFFVSAQNSNLAKVTEYNQIFCHSFCCDGTFSLVSFTQVRLSQHFFFFFDRVISVPGLFFFFFFFFYCYSITVLCLFSPSLQTTLAETPSSPTSTLPLDLAHVSCKVVPVKPSSHCPLPTPPCPLLDFLNINVSGYILFLFSSIYYVPVKGDIIWYLSLTIWLISLSIMLSSSIHDVAKGRSSFFLSSVQYSFHCVNVQQFLIHSFTDGHLGCFQHLAIIKLCCYEH